MFGFRIVYLAEFMPKKHRGKTLTLANMVRTHSFSSLIDDVMQVTRLLYPDHPSSSIVILKQLYQVKYWYSFLLLNCTIVTKKLSTNFLPNRAVDVTLDITKIYSEFKQPGVTCFEVQTVINGLKKGFDIVPW